jgi:hypothetical protein
VVAFWQHSGQLKDGALSAVADGYVLRIGVKGPANGELFAEEALRDIEERLR